MKMKRITTIGAICVAAVLLPAAGASAKPGQAKRLTVKQCQAERKADPAAFEAKYGKPAMRNCIRANIEEFRNAAKECRAEREADPAAFQETWGTNESDGQGAKRNAFGKCVSGKVKEGEPGEEPEA